jgi:acetolactate synthase small subunit
MWLLVNEEERLQQLIRQTEKLVDVNRPGFVGDSIS